MCAQTNANGDIRVSVCMATYNGSRYLQEQIASVLEQLGALDELVISDDGSLDNTLEIARSFNDPRIFILPIQHFRSPVRNFENALAAARGRFVFLCDQDDVWLPGKVEHMVAELEEGYDLVLSDCYITDQDLHIRASSFFKVNGSRSGLLNVLRKNPYIGCCMAMRNNLLQVVLPFPADIPMHDYWIGFAAELTGKVKFMKTPMLYYRRHGANESASGEKSPFNLLQQLRFRWNLLRHIFLLWGRQRKQRSLFTR